MPPRILRAAVKTDLPLCLVKVAKRVAWRHDKAVVKQSHAVIGRLAFALEFDTANQGLVTECDEIDVVADHLVVVGGNGLSIFVKLDPASDDGGRRTSSRYCSAPTSDCRRKGGRRRRFRRGRDGGAGFAGALCLCAASASRRCCALISAGVGIFLGAVVMVLGSL